MKITSPSMKIRFLPIISASRPTLNSSTLRPSRKANTTHWMVGKSVWKFATSVGSATLTMVPSMAPMNSAKLTAMRINHLSWYGLSKLLPHFRWADRVDIFQRWYPQRFHGSIIAGFVIKATSACCRHPNL